MIQRKSVVFTASAFLFLIVFSNSSLIASQENSNKPSFNSLISQSENSDPTSVNSNPSNPQSAIQNLSPTSIGDPQGKKAEAIQKTAKLQMPFIANNGQTDERVKFYANTFGGTVFVTKDGEIVYSLPVGSSELRVRSEELGSKKAGARSRKSEERRPECRGELHSPNLISPLKRGAGGVSKHSQKPVSEPNKILTLKENSSPRPLRERDRVRGVSLKEELVGGKISEIKGEKKAVTNVNYFKGKDPSKWKTNISTYDIVNLGEVYDGIEFKLKAYGNNVEKLFCVKTGADPQQIKIRLSGMQPSESSMTEETQPPESPFINGDLTKSPLEKGARGLSVNEHGELEVETELGTIKFTKPVAYQEIGGKRVYVECGYVIAKDESKTTDFTDFTDIKGTNSEFQIPNSNNSQLATVNSKLETDTDNGHDQRAIYGFKVAAYDRTKELVIDPLLASTYLGGSNYDLGFSLAIDSDGNVYVTGGTYSSDFPTTLGTYDTSYNGNCDVFVSKLNGSLTNLLASTYLDGSSQDFGYSLAIDSDGNIYVTGNTLSSDFPTTPGAYDTSFNGISDIFISKLNGSLTSILASTYLGGSDGDYGYSVTIDSGGNIYVAGAGGSDFPTTPGAYDTSYNGGGNDVFISKLNGSLTSLLASTYLGGSALEYFYVPLAIDPGGNVYVTGWTYSSDFPTTPGGYDTSFNNSVVGADVFISKLNGSLTNLLASTYLGGSGDDFGFSLAIDSGGNIYVTGETRSSDFPATPGVYDASYNGGTSDVFISKLSGSLTSLLASTYLGGSDSVEEWGFSLATDSGGNIYVTGAAGSFFPTTSGAYDTSGNGDIFISKLSGSLTSILASTYLGGSDGDYGYSVTIDSGGNVYVSGYTLSSDFPTTTGAYDTSYNGSGDAFVSKFDSNLSATSTTPTPSPSPSPSPTPTSTPTATSTTTAVPTPTPSPTPTLSQSPPFGLTIITHGYQLFGAYPTWVDEMAVAIANRFGGTNTIPIYTMKITEDDSGQIIAKDEDFVKVTSAPDFKSAGGAIIKVDWSDLSCNYTCLEGTSTTSVGDAIFTKLEKNVSGAWLQVPIHLIGHSRGASVNSRLAYDLGVHGIWVDHFTTLDPHPVPSFGDWNVKVYENVLFADNNYQQRGVLTGKQVDGTYERDLTDILSAVGYKCDRSGYLDSTEKGAPHEQVHTYYHGTILGDDACADQVLVQYDWYEPKYPYRETGYYFSRIGKGDRYSSDDSGIEPLIHPRDGLHYRLTTLSTSNRESFDNVDISPAWPNATFKPFANKSDYDVQIGTEVVFTYYYQDADSKLDIMFALDNDTNPFNNSNNNYYKEIGSQTGKTERRVISAATEFNWIPTDADTGTYYVQIKATDADRRVRYDYLLKPINVKINTEPVCNATDIIASQKTLTIKKKGSDEVTVTVTGNEGCPVVREKVTATIKSGNEKLSVSPQRARTDTNGQAMFTITATKKTGDAKVRFKAAGVETIVKVKVVK